MCVVCMHICKHVCFIHTFMHIYMCVCLFMYGVVGIVVLVHRFLYIHALVGKICGVLNGVNCKSYYILYF